MQVDFLSAELPLSKSFTKTEAGLNEQSFPMVTNMTSHREEWETTHDLYTLLRKHAAEGHCLLKGLLARPINNEPRRGMTIPNAPTQFLILDNDFTDGFNSIDELLNTLDPALGDTTYILQHSASAGVKYDPGLRSHIAVKLNEPVAAPLLKHWLIRLNLTVPQLRDQIRLNASGLALIYPLDVTTCQNDKLIYIADPQCEGIEDGMAGKRFEYHERDNEVYVADPTLNAELNRQQADELVAQLRAAAGLKKRTAKYTQFGDDEILTNPDRAVVTSTRVGHGFVRVNLNGGDSWAYWHRTTEPDLLYNFKGEPTVRLKDIAPDYYASLRPAKPQGGKKKPLAFRDREADQYYNGFYDPNTGDVDISPVGSLQRIQHFFVDNNHEPPKVVEDWRYEFRPSTNEQVDFDNRWVNSFNPTEYMKHPASAPPDVPAETKRLIMHVVNHNEEFYEWFINWMAFIFQNRGKTGTAVILHGTQGTGKGQLFHRVLKPLLGTKHTLEVITTQFDDKFNAEFECNLLCFVDETSVDDTSSSRKTMNMLKNQITEPQLVIRGMRKNPVTRPNFSNYIFASNMQAPIEIQTGDRRFCVAPRQERKLQITDAQLAMLEIELPLFAGYLATYSVDESAVHTVLENDARAQMINASTTSVDAFFQALMAGDLEFFAEYLQKGTPITPGNSYLDFKQAIHGWAQNVGEPILVLKEEMQQTFQYLQNIQMGPTKFARTCTMHKCELQRVRVGDTRMKGLMVTWKADDETVLKVLGPPEQTP